MKQNITYGILIMLFSAALFSLMSAEAKILMQSLPAMEVAFFRGFIMLILLLPIVYKIPLKNPTHKKGGWWILFSRSFTGGISFVAFFYNISTIPLGTATAFAQSMPLYMVILSLLFLNERFSFIVICSTIVGFIGILLICNPHFNDLENINIIFGIATGLCMAISFFNLRILRQYFNSWVAVFATGLTMSSVALIIYIYTLPPFADTWVMPKGLQWLHIALLGIFGTLAQHYLTRAYMLAPAGIVAPIDYTRLVFSIALGVILGDNLPNLLTGFGLALIILSGIGVGLPILLSDIKAYSKFSSSLNARQDKI